MRGEWVVALVILVSCSSASQSAEPPTQKADSIIISDTLEINLARSILHWKGTKMRGLGKHEGIINLSGASLLTQGDRLVGGSFTIDMTSIQVTDIPAHETVPRRRLVNHLKSEDFFDVANYPVSRLEIAVVNPIGDSLQITGNLTIKEITKPITFNAFKQKNELTALIVFDRFRWNVAYEGNLIDRTLVDPKIELKVILKME
ncbi:YceI family protein [Marinoscillum sp.]|uniref:YceI family protein n=1 Tax=Marinoscillum sp. TaxID=2024838 RepID=UPI003BA8B684